MEERAPEMTFVEVKMFQGQGLVGQVVDEQVEAKSGSDAENGGQSESDAAGIEDDFLPASFRSAVQRERADAGFLGADAVHGSVARPRAGVNQGLTRRQAVGNVLRAADIHFRRQIRFLAAGRVAHYGGEMDDSDFAPDHLFHCLFVADVALDDVHQGVLHDRQQGGDPPPEAVEDGHFKAAPQQQGHERATHIARPAGDQHVAFIGDAVVAVVEAVDEITVGGVGARGWFHCQVVRSRFLKNTTIKNK